MSALAIAKATPPLSAAQTELLTQVLDGLDSAGELHWFGSAPIITIPAAIAAAAWPFPDCEYRP